MTAASTENAYDPNDDWPGRKKGAPAPVPNVKDMRAHLEALFGGDRCAGMLNGRVEISWTDIYGKLVHAAMFELDELDKAAEYAAERNANRGVNVFVGAALRKPDAPIGKRARKEHVLGATAVPVDWDDEGEGDPAAIRRKTAFLPPNIVVVTGERPWMRSQGWWLLDEPLIGAEAIEVLMKPMARSLNGDKAVVNADRVMRLAGSVAWPHKPGRIREQTRLVTTFQADGDKPRPLVYSTERVLRAFQPQSDGGEAPDPDRPTAGASSTGAGSAHDDPDARNPFTGRRNAEALLHSIREGNWHTPVRDFTAHMVMMNRQDWEIMAMLAPYHDPNHQGEKPEDLIRQARQKWSKPNPADPASEFDFSQNPPAPFDPSPFGPWNAEDIEPRSWLFGEWLSPGILTMLIAVGGLGKSILAIHTALALAAGREWMGQRCVEGPGNVWIYNNEDDITELRRRVIGGAKHLGIPLDSIRDRVFLNSGLNDGKGEGTGTPLIVAELGDKGMVVQTPGVEGMIEYIRAKNIKLLIVDPFVSTHRGLNENDNSQMDAVARIFVRIAKKTGCAVLLIHHMSKPGDQDQAGNVHRARGASSVVYVARVTLTLTPMTEKDAKKMMGEDFDEAMRERCMRLDTGSANLSASGKHTIWIKKDTVSLGNGNMLSGRDSDEVGGLTLADFSEYQQPIKQKAQDTKDKLLVLVAEIMKDVPVDGEMPLSKLVTAIVENGGFGSKNTVRDALDEAIPMAAAGKVPMGDYVLWMRRDGVANNAPLFVCKRPAE